MNRREFVKLGPAFPAAAVTATLTLKEEGMPAVEGLDVSVLRLKAGDYVVLRCDGHITQDAAARIKAAWADAVPGTAAIVLDAGIRVDGVLRWPEERG